VQSPDRAIPNGLDACTFLLWRVLYAQAALGWVAQSSCKDINCIAEAYNRSGEERAILGRQVCALSTGPAYPLLLQAGEASGRLLSLLSAGQLCDLVLKDFPEALIRWFKLVEFMAVAHDLTRWRLHNRDRRRRQSSIPAQRLGLLLVETSVRRRAASSPLSVCEVPHGSFTRPAL